jgi:hypothetical protein
MGSLRDRYFHTPGLDADAENAACMRKLAPKRAYELRNFEIEHYWKRATYFWGFQLAVFAGFGLLWRLEPRSTDWLPIAIAFAGIGVLTGVANALSAQGSRFWQENWEKHIDFLEDEIEGRLYKTVWLKRAKGSYSVSRLNQLLSWYIVGFWIIVGAYVCWRFAGAPPYWKYWTDFPIRWIYVIAISGMVAIGSVALLTRRSRLEGSEPREDGSHGTPINLPRGSGKRPLMRRYAQDEP